MKILLILVVCIFVYECYWPIPDRDREQFDFYVDRVVLDKKIPKEELIYFRITSEEKLKIYKAHRPEFNFGEKKILNKFKKWLLQKQSEN